MTEKTDILTDEQIETLIMQLAKGQREFTEEQAGKVLDWAKKTLVNYALLELILKSKMKITVAENGELKFEKE